MSECTICKGTGKLTHTTEDDRSRTSWTSLCECRRSLPPRRGNAHYWVYGTPKDEEIETGTGFRFGVRWTPELPVSEDNYPLIRTHENSHFVGSIRLAFEDSPVLTTDGLREIAAFLTRMAGQIDEWDKLVPDPEPTNPQIREVPG